MTDASIKPPLPDDVYYAQLPRKVSSGGCLIRDDAGHVLIVKPTYKLGWEIPGGVSELGESPRITAEREIQEELNLRIAVGRALCIDHVAAEPPRMEALNFVFDGGVLTRAQIRQIVLPRAELSEFRFCTVNEARALVVPRLNPRLAMAAHALSSGTMLYLENGERVA